MAITRQAVGWTLVVAALPAALIGRGLLYESEGDDFIAGHPLETAAEWWGERLGLIGIVVGCAGLWLAAEDPRAPLRFVASVAVELRDLAVEVVDEIRRLRRRSRSAASAGTVTVAGGDTTASDPVTDVPSAKRAPSATSDSPPATGNEGLALRYPTYFGLAGGLGATAGWFLCIALAIFRANVSETLLSVLVGTIVGLVVEFGRKYLQVAYEPVSGDGGPPARWLRTTGLFVVLTLVAQVILENTFSELVKEVYQPFLISLATFFIGGAMIGLIWAVLVAATEMSVAPMFLFVAPITCLMVGAAVWIFQRIITPTASYDAIGGWWSVVCLIALAALRLCWGAHRLPAPAHTIVWLGSVLLTTTVVAVLLFLATFTAAEVSAKYSLSRTGRAWTQFGVEISESILTAPDVPANSWADAERRLSHQAAAHLLQVSPSQRVSSTVRSIAGCNHLPSKPTDAQPPRFLERKKAACQLAASHGTGLGRSMLVMLSFLICLGYAPLIESRTRPNNYRQHPLRHYDRALAVALAVATALIGLLN